VDPPERAGTIFALQLKMAPITCDVIVVDDDPDFADSLVELLEEEQYRAMSFPTPEGAFEWMLEGNRTSVVVLDLHTTGISAQRFRALMLSASHLHDIPIVMVSGDPHVGVVAHSVGAVDAFQKPIDVERLIGRLHQFRAPSLGAV
jgi:two-component system response regulator TtrR